MSLATVSSLLSLFILTICIADVSRNEFLETALVAVARQRVTRRPLAPHDQTLTEKVGLEALRVFGALISSRGPLSSLYLLSSLLLFKRSENRILSMLPDWPLEGRRFPRQSGDGGCFPKSPHGSPGRHSFLGCSLHRSLPGWPQLIPVLESCLGWEWEAVVCILSGKKPLKSPRPYS